MAQNLISINSDLRKDSDEDHAFRKRQQKQYPGLYKEAYQIIYQKSCPEVSTDSCQKKNFQVSQKPYLKLPCQETLQSQAPKLSEQPYQEIDLESKQNPFAKLCEEPYQIEYKVLNQKSSTDELSPKVSRQSLLNAQPKLCIEPYQEWSVDSYSELSPEKYQKLYYEKIQKSYVVERHDQCPKLCQEDYISPCSEEHQNPYQELSEKSHSQKYKEVLLPEESDIWKYQELCEHMVSAEALTREQSPDVSKEPELSHKTFPKFQYSDCLQNTEFSIKLNQEVTMTPNAIDRPIKILPPSRRLAGMGYGNISQKRTCSNVPRNMTAQTSRTPCGMCDISSQTCERVSNYNRSPSHAPGPRPPIKSRRPPADIRYHEPYPSARRPGQSQGSRSIQRNETNWESYEVEADQVNQSINNSDRTRANTCRMCCESNDGKSSQCCGKSKCAKPPPKPFCEPCGSTKENFWESNNPPPETYRKTKGEPQIRSKSCPPAKPVDQSCPICATPDYSSYSKSYGAGPSQQSAFQSPRNSANPNYRDQSTKANLQLCPHCEKLFEQRAVPSLYREDSCESDYASSKLDPRGKYRSQKQCEPTESTDSHICRNPSCSKALKKPSTYGYRPCQAPQFPETQFTVNESKVDYMELQSGSGRFYKNPLTVSSCSCNIKERFIPESKRNSEPPRPHCDYSRSRSEEMHGRNHGLPPLNNNACGANFVPVNYFQEKSTPKRKQRFSSGLAPRVSNITQRTGAQSANSSFAHVTPESSLHLAKRRYKLYHRRLSGCGATMTTKKFLQLSMKSRLFCPSKLHTKLMPSHQSIFTLSSQRMPIAKPCTVRVPSKALRLSECLCQKCRQRCRGGKLTANTNSLHSNRNTRISRPKVQTPSAAQRSNQASGSRPNRTQSTTVKREKVSIQTQTHSRSSRLRDQATIRAKLRLDLPTRYQLQSQDQQNSRSTSRALTRNTSVLGRERIDRAAAQKRQQQQQQSRVAERLPKGETERRQELVQEHERRQDQESEGRLNQYQTNQKSSNLTPQPQQLPNDPVRVMPPSHMRSHDSAGCMGTNIHHFYRGSFLSIRPTLPSDDTQVASGSRQRQSLLHVAESILRTDFMQPPKPRGSSFIVQNKWQYIPNFNGFAGAMAIQNLKSTNESRHINKNGGWLRSFRKLLPNWLFNSKIKATSA